ncbi:MAG: hypothetical protein IT369_00425 [Candidatus Latescibacteria bacterium]|nr:hypothetical protein [Candidatus Latescibacterota bacterium]
MAQIEDKKGRWIETLEAEIRERRFGLSSRFPAAIETVLYQDADILVKSLPRPRNDLLYIEERGSPVEGARVWVSAGNNGPSKGVFAGMTDVKGGLLLGKKGRYKDVVDPLIMQIRWLPAVVADSKAVPIVVASQIFGFPFNPARAAPPGLGVDRALELEAMTLCRGIEASIKVARGDVLVGLTSADYRTAGLEMGIAEHSAGTRRMLYQGKTDPLGTWKVCPAPLVEQLSANAVAELLLLTQLDYQGE